MYEYNFREHAYENKAMIPESDQVSRLKEEGRQRTLSGSSTGIGGGGPTHFGRFAHVDYPNPDGTTPSHDTDKIGFGGHGGPALQLPKMDSHNLHKADLPISRP